jgi:hypothetical protein
MFSVRDPDSISYVNIVVRLRSCRASDQMHHSPRTAPCLNRSNAALQSDAHPVSPAMEAAHQQKATQHPHHHLLPAHRPHHLRDPSSRGHKPNQHLRRPSALPTLLHARECHLYATYPIILHQFLLSLPFVAISTASLPSLRLFFTKPDTGSSAKSYGRSLRQPASEFADTLHGNKGRIPLQTVVKSGKGRMTRAHSDDSQEEIWGKGNWTGVRVDRDFTVE